MTSNIRILAIAPYEEMKPILLQLSKEYNQVEMTVLVGDLNKGVEMAKNNYHDNYDYIISRGGTAKLIQKSVSIPVIEIHTSIYDILRTLKLSGAEMNKVAIVGFPNITEQSLFLKEVLPFKIDVFSIESDDDSLVVLNNIKKQNYHAVLCDMITYTTAQTLGLDSYLITSGNISLHDAIKETIRHAKYQNHLRSENHFFRKLTKVKDTQTIVFAEDKKLFYTTFLNEVFPFTENLISKIDNTIKNGKQHLIYQCDNIRYSVHAQPFTSDDSIYVVFHITSGKVAVSSKKSGLYYLNKDEVEKDILNSIYNTINFFAPYMSSLKQANENLSPVIITGEEGTGKEQIAKALYLNSSLNNQPFVQIDCDQTSIEVWDFLLNHYDSPFSASQYTIHIKNINFLSHDLKRQLWLAINDMDIHKRNRLIISCVSSLDHRLDSFSMNFINQLNFFVIVLPAIRENLSRIEPILNLTLNKLNINSKHPILGFSQEAIDILSSYHWPYNFMQLGRVLTNLILMADGSLITAQHVETALSKELMIAPASSEHSRHLLDLSKPMTEINKDIAHILVEANNGNKTTSAASLKISRTTLWRLLNDK